MHVYLESITVTFGRGSYAYLICKHHGHLREVKLRTSNLVGITVTFGSGSYARLICMHYSYLREGKLRTSNL